MVVLLISEHGLNGLNEYMKQQLTAINQQLLIR